MYDNYRFPNYHNCIKVYQCRLVGNFRKIQEKVYYLGKVYYVVCEHFISVIDDLDCHLKIHLTDTPSETLPNANMQMFKHYTYEA